MAKIHKLKKDNVTLYPATIPQAVIDPETGKTVKQITERYDNIFNDISESHNLKSKGVIVDGFFLNTAGIQIASPLISYVTIDVTENTYIYMYAKQLPIENLSSKIVFKNGEALISSITNVPLKNTEMIAFLVPIGANKLIYNFLTSEYNRFEILSGGFYLDRLKEDDLLKNNLRYNIFENNPLYKLGGYFRSDLLFIISGTIKSTAPYPCNEGDVFEVENCSSTSLPMSGISFWIVHFNSNGVRIIQDVHKETDPYTHTIPSGVAFVSFLYASGQESYLTIYKKTPSSKVQILKEFIFPQIKEFEELSDHWSGGKWAYFGDSLSFREIWQPYVIAELGLVGANCGIGSTFLAGTSANAFHQEARIQSVINANPDIVSILGGANDLTADTPIGADTEFDKSLGTKDKTTFKGAYSFIIETLLTWKPSLRVVILTTSYAHLGGASFSPSGTMRYYMYADASREVARHYGLPVVDLYREMGVNKISQEIYTTDNIHWNDNGGKVVASLFINIMKKIKSV